MGRAYPDFLGIGAQKAGTTWLYRNLRAHPEIWMPPRKEIHYFDRKAGGRAALLPGLVGGRREDREWRGQVVGWARTRARERPALENLLWGLRYHTGSFDDGWYASLFEPGRGRIVGEITPSYSVLDEEAVARVHRLMPEAKLIFFMRNPIERAWSQAVMSFDRLGEGAAGSLPERRLLRRLERANVHRLTDYLRTLGTWGSYYPGERVFVGFLEDVSLFPGELLARLYAFLGVDPSFRPPGFEEKVHTRSVGRMPVGVAARLAGAYREETERLSERFGGYAGFWLYCARRLADGSRRGGYVAYPFAGSPLWEEWVGSVGEPRGARSGVLASVAGGAG